MLNGFFARVVSTTLQVLLDVFYLEFVSQVLELNVVNLLLMGPNSPRFSLNGKFVSAVVNT